MGCGASKKPPVVEERTVETPRADDVPLIRKHAAGSALGEALEELGRNELLERCAAIASRFAELRSARRLHALQVEEAKERARWHGTRGSTLPADPSIGSEEVRRRFQVQNTFGLEATVVRRRGSIRAAMEQLPVLESHGRERVKAFARAERAAAGVLLAALRAEERGRAALEALLGLCRAAAAVELSEGLTRCAESIEARFSFLAACREMGYERMYISTAEAETMMRNRRGVKEGAVRLLIAELRSRSTVQLRETLLRGFFAAALSLQGGEQWPRMMVEADWVRQYHWMVLTEPLVRQESEARKEAAAGEQLARADLSAVNDHQLAELAARSRIERTARLEHLAKCYLRDSLGQLLRERAMLRAEEDAGRVAVGAVLVQGQAAECIACGVDPGVVWRHWGRVRDHLPSEEHEGRRGLERQVAVAERVTRQLAFTEHEQRKAAAAAEVRARRELRFAARAEKPIGQPPPEEQDGPSPSVEDFWGSPRCITARPATAGRRDCTWAASLRPPYSAEDSFCPAAAGPFVRRRPMSAAAAHGRRQLPPVSAGSFAAATAVSVASSPGLSSVPTDSRPGSAFSRPSPYRRRFGPGSPVRRQMSPASGRKGSLPPRG
eukprot:TRINITY_DN72185_c0_g1_i1.p1 TRINITY_DN72185_c0_g1~~TRINITY_DN72185_c0_g1_i1.p1  ORF type:complete len:645 (+),score=80.48 TRINITY_DN72185_c0_g1_i1:103-1935(+)